MGGDGSEEPLSAEIHDPDASGEWDEVSESWIEDDGAKLAPAGRRRKLPPPPRRGDRASDPPPLPPPHIIAAMLERLAAEDWEGTLLAARTALAIHPTNDDAKQCLEMASSSLRALYRTRLGLAEGEDGVPHRTSVSPLQLDRRARTVYELVNGERTVEAVCGRSPLGPLDTLKILAELYLTNVLLLRR